MSPFAGNVTNAVLPLIPTATAVAVYVDGGMIMIPDVVRFETDPFTHGQLYVALSRVGGWDQVCTYYQGDDVLNVVLRHLLN